ncbi:pancreatic triacylglycerol lipase-like isoform X3 [Stegodyphus dumicola]|uniref:pancreatic triacylglycerol lipase-like isoform X3 n=1 Tax=Stegodyphus dumicola TaxID=202533 RepID=UPI0015B10994|nr:pancreatic triacylglycerol lipase-like isoform X3 [Stegodyphus dumicola]
MDIRLAWATVVLIIHCAPAKQEEDVPESSLKVGAPPLLAPPDPDLLLQRCYGRWGCFSIGEPFLSIYRPVNLFPLHPDVLDVKFFLKTRRNPDLFNKLRPESNESFTQQNLNPKQGVKFIIHGYLEHGHQKWIQDMIRELLTKDNFNVISVDWVFGAAPPYTQAVANARMVGAVLAEFIEILRDVYAIPLSSMHLIGHSLGAHVAGYAGERLNKRLGRITGLDPAEPYFQYTMEEVRLDPTDAQFVDVIHTDGGSIITGGLGMIQDCGHVDFYPNGGKRQPGCNQNVVGAIEKEGDLLYGHHYYIHLRCSYSDEARMHITEKGRLFIRLTGTKAQSPVLEAKKDYVQFVPGGVVEFLVSTTEMGRLLRLDLEWRSTASLLNPLTWRLFNVPQIYIRDVIVTHLETGERVVFCGKDEPIIPHKIKTIFADQSCRQPPKISVFPEDLKKPNVDIIAPYREARFYS